MALRTMTAQELAGTTSVFGSFMGCRAGAGRRTIGELLAIYRERRAEVEAMGDPDDDLRVGRFMRDMADERWREEVVMRIGVFDGEVHVVDGTHRAIAYLGCLQEGVGSEHLPALCVDC